MEMFVPWSFILLSQTASVPFMVSPTVASMLKRLVRPPGRGGDSFPLLLNNWQGPHQTSNYLDPPLFDFPQTAEVSPGYYSPTRLMLRGEIPPTDARLPATGSSLMHVR